MLKKYEHIASQARQHRVKGYRQNLIKIGSHGGNNGFNNLAFNTVPPSADGGGHLSCLSCKSPSVENCLIFQTRACPSGLSTKSRLPVQTHRRRRRRRRFRLSVGPRSVSDSTGFWSEWLKKTFCSESTSREQEERRLFCSLRCTAVAKSLALALDMFNLSTVHQLSSKEKKITTAEKGF